MNHKEEKYRVVGELSVDGSEPGILSVGRSAINAREGHLSLIHVMSRAAGGEVRGYVSVDGGPWKVRHPNYTGEWPTMDRAVEKLCGIEVVA